MGDRGGTATKSRTCTAYNDYTRWEIGGEPQLRRVTIGPRLELYPMGDRGGTATVNSFTPRHMNYTRWEIGGEPQRMRYDTVTESIIPDGRSGGNRNTAIAFEI